MYVCMYVCMYACIANTAVVGSVAVVGGLVAVSFRRQGILVLTYISINFTRDKTFSKTVFFDCNS